MKNKVNKVTVGTRLTINEKNELEQEAQANDLSFCRYLEHLLINRDNTSDNYVRALKEDLAFIQRERDELMDEVEDLQATITELQTSEPSELEQQELLDRIQELENQVSELEEENELLQTIDEDDSDFEEVNSEEAVQALLDEIETEKEALESENKTLKQQIDQLQVVAKQNAPNFNTDALQFLKDKHPNLSKEEIIKVSLDCSATNDGKRWYDTMYSFTDYLEEDRPFINYQNN